MTVGIGAGYRWTLSDVRDYFGDGYNFNGLGRKDFSLPASIEFRYHDIWGPEINPSEAGSLTGTNGKRANEQFLPITVGIRF